jgi:RNA polymerase sigma-70 factor (ECF subfamily)
MKNSLASAHSHGVLRALALAPSEDGTRSEAAVVEELFRAHAQFVWRTLHRMGVAAPDLPDLLQEVFVVVQRRIGSFDPSTRATTWLFAIAARVAANHRRSARHRREALVADPPEREAGDDPEANAERRRATLELARALDTLTPAHRAVLVMFELEGMSGEEIAGELGIPLGTVHSRLHHAKKRVLDELPRSMGGAR